MINIKNIVALILAVLLAGVACYADNRPQFWGPNRDGKSTETGLLKKWPESEPEMPCSVGGLGIGFSSVAISNGRLYIRHGNALTAYDIKNK